jgi:hypothetical protein
MGKTNTNASEAAVHIYAMFGIGIPRGNRMRDSDCCILDN